MAVIEADEKQEPAARVSAAKMFRYSEFVDVGDGAAECEHARDGECEDPEHFHAWCRLPNPYQHSDIRAKGLAAKARRLRLLKDPDSDEAVVLDQSFAMVDDPSFTEVLIDELVGREWAEDYLEAARDLEETETFEHIEQDREEYNRLAATERTLSAEEQSADYKRLDAHIVAYSTAIRERLAEIQEPKRVELRAHEFPKLLEIVRARRVEEDGDRVFVETYNAWMWFVGTFKVERHASLGRPYLPMWSDLGTRDRPAAGTMFGEAPEVIDALAATYSALQVALQRGSAGN
jgi:hypothetical protein